jgi:hypothetical protein
VACLYCGKEIGAFRLLRDSEFCGNAHRKAYGERLGKALHKIAEPEPPPAPMANFVSMMPFQEGHKISILASPQTYRCSTFQMLASWPLDVDGCLGRRHRTTLPGAQPVATGKRFRYDSEPRVASASLRLPHLDASPVPMPIPVDEPVETIPPFCGRWMPSAAAEPVASWVSMATALAPVARQALRLPPQLCKTPIRRLEIARTCTPPSAEPVAIFVRPATALTPVAAVPARRESAAIRVPEWQKTLPLAGPAPSAAPEPVAMWVNTVTALTPIAVQAERRPIVIEMPLGRRQPELAGACAAPAAEPVARFVSPVTALTPFAALPLRREVSAIRILEWQNTLPLAGPAASDAAEPVAGQAECLPRQPKLAAACAAPAAEPVARFVWPATALTPLAMTPRACIVPEFSLPAAPNAGVAEESFAESAGPALSAGETICATKEFAGHSSTLPEFLPSAAGIWAGAGAVAALAPEPAERFLHLAASLIPATSAAAAPLLQQLDIAAEFEPLPEPDDLLEPPAICLRAMPGPAPEPVCLFVRNSEASFLKPDFLTVLPAFELEVRAPYVPFIPRVKPAAAAEPVMSGVHPRIADFPVAPIANAALLALPQTPGMAQQLFGLATPVAGPAAEPAERLVIAAESAVPASVAPETRVPDTAGFVLANPDPAPALCRPAASLTAEPLESLLVASSAEAPAAAARMRVLEFTIEASEDLRSQGFDTPRLAPTAAKPRPDAAKVVALRPIPTFAVAAPEQQHTRLQPALPQPGMLPVEFHTQRSRTTLHERPEWMTSRLAPLPPRFAVRPAFGKLEDPAPQPKPAKQEPEFIKTFQRPANKPSPMFLLGGKIAAAIMLASSLWYAYSIRAHLPATVELAAGTQPMASSGRNTGPSTAPAAGPQTAASSNGPVAWLRQTIARRASVEVTDHFREGMEGWGSNGASKPAGWSHHPDGYTVPGALALFRPSMNFKNYRLEFFGQIENKGMSWSVRAKDPRNYHAMKVSVMEAGLRPFVALVHWDVIDGKAGRQSRTPLNIMVHNNRPMEVAVNVEDNHLITSIDGEEVESFTYNTLASGGVGFFSEANERARLYWMKVSKNDDWLGHVCGFLAGDDAVRATAELWGPQIPGGAPAPGMPREDSTTLAAVWAGLPYLRAAQKARASNTRRTKQWNT